jgi:hypothetical protein
MALRRTLAVAAAAIGGAAALTFISLSSISAAAAPNLAITPASFSVTADGNVTYTATTTDSLGNSLDVTAGTTFTITPDGSCSGRFCGSTVSGLHTVTASYQGAAAMASLTVTHGQVTRLVLSPASATIVAGGSQGYTSVAYDRYGNSFGEVTASTTFYVDSTVNPPCAANTCSTTNAGPHQVVGEWNTVAGASPLTVTGGPVDHITLSPLTTTITAGSNMTYAVEAFDQYGNDLGDATGATTFSLSPDGSCSGSSCTATKAGTHTVTGTDSGKYAAATLSVTAGPAATLTISPVSATAIVGSSTPFTATAADSYGNTLGDVTAATTFNMYSNGPYPNGYCYPSAGCGSTVAGVYTIAAQYQWVYGQATLTLTPGLLDHTAVYGTTVMTAGGAATYSARAYDQYNNLIGDVTSFTSFTLGGVKASTPCNANVCSTTVAGNYGVIGVYNGLSGWASLQVTPGPLDHITLSPAAASLTAGGAQPYVVEAYDQYGNDIGNQTTASTLSIAPDGSCSANACTATRVGAHTVNANDAGKSAAASLSVTAGLLDHLSLTSPTASITAGGSQAYTVEGFDAYGNDLGPFTANSSFAIAPDGSCSGASCGATVAGGHTVTASSQGKSVTASLAVNAGPLATIKVSPAAASVVVGQVQGLTASAADAYGNPLSAGAASWSLSTGVLGTVSPAAGSSTTFSASASNTGALSIKASMGSIAGTATISVVPATPANLVEVVKTAKVDLTWTASAGDKSYNIYRGMSPTNLVLLKSNFPSTSFTDNPGSGTYYYYVVAVGSSGQQSSPSNIVSATFK